MAMDEKLKTELKETYFIGLVVAVIVVVIIAGLMVIARYWPEWLVPTPWTDNVWWKALLALFINYAIVFSITFGGQSLAPNLPDFFGNVKDKKTKNIINSLVWSLIFIGILLVFWPLILFFSPDSIQNGLPLDTVRGFFRLILGILPAEWILSLFEGATFPEATFPEVTFPEVTGSFFIDNSWMTASVALVINYVIVFLITWVCQSLAPNLPDFFGDEKDKTAKNAKNSSVWSLIFIGILLVFWSLILFIFPNSIQNRLPLDTGSGLVRVLLGILPAEWILSLFQEFTPTFTAETANNITAREYASIGGKKGKKKKGKKGGGFIGGDDASTIPVAEWSQIFWTTTK